MDSRSIPSSHGSSEQLAVEALYATGHALLCGDRHAEAAGVFRIMLQVVPEDERSWLALGECHERAGHRDVALELYGAATCATHAPRCALARFRLLYDMDASDEATEAWEEARELAEREDDPNLIETVEAERRLRP